MRNPEVVEYLFDNTHPGNDNDAFMITSVTNLRTQVWMATHEYTVSMRCLRVGDGQVGTPILRREATDDGLL